MVQFILEHMFCKHRFFLVSKPPKTVLRVLEVEVLNTIGIPVSLAGKTLRGDPAKDWPTSLSAPRPDSGHILPEAGIQW